MSERRWDRGVWLTLAVALGGSVLALTACAGALQCPSNGWTIRRNTSNGETLRNHDMLGRASPLRDFVVATGAFGVTLAAFGAQASDVVELEQLSDQLIAAVDETMQPAHVGLWVRADTRPSLRELGQWT